MTSVVFAEYEKIVRLSPALKVNDRGMVAHHQAAEDPQIEPSVTDRPPRYISLPVQIGACVAFGAYYAAIILATPVLMFAGIVIDGLERLQ